MTLIKYYSKPLMQLSCLEKTSNFKSIANLEFYSKLRTVTYYIKSIQEIIYWNDLCCQKLRTISGAKQYWREYMRQDSVSRELSKLMTDKDRQAVINSEIAKIKQHSEDLQKSLKSFQVLRHKATQKRIKYLKGR